MLQCESVTPATTNPIFSLADLEFELLFTVGSTKIPAEEIASLQPGFVIPVAGRVDCPIRITAAGKLLALAELVQIDGQLAVCVREVL